jgi:hypothetical protein
VRNQVGQEGEEPYEVLSSQHLIPSCVYRDLSRSQSAKPGVEYDWKRVWRSTYLRSDDLVEYHKETSLKEHRPLYSNRFREAKSSESY